jgi:hypothetical protein
MCQVKTKILLTISMFALLATTFAYGAEPLAKASIPFQFMAAGKVLPAGEYEFASDVRTGVVRIVSTPRGSAAIAPIITRLGAGMHTTPVDAHLVFDKVGDTYTLSEIWVPNLDGFLLHATKGKHEHKIVDVPR